MSRPGQFCAHSQASTEFWDHGKDPATGYRDTGISVTCLDCGEKFDEADFRRELERGPLRVPRPGDVYRQFGFRLIIIDVDDDEVHYVCRSDSFTGPLRKVSLKSFLHNLSHGFITLAVTHG